jgi:2-polyprenyl-3-methyl-5-hydroxy-6-metoxy-1,4-benzoquinol methylase
MMVRGAALKGGMPVYKYVGNRILTEMQNKLVGLDLSEWHSGYRAYRVDALAELPLASYSDGFDFDTEIILGLATAGKRIIEVPIPTYYGDEICYVNGMQYAKDVTVDVMRHWVHQRGFGGGVTTAEPDNYALKTVHGSHGVLLNWLDAKPRGRVLDAGCFDGRFAAHVAAMGHTVVGVDKVKHEGLADRLHEFVEADLNQPLPESVPRDFDVVVAGDILEHVLEPHELLADLRDHMLPEGELMVSVPNFNHWYPRGRIAVGRFDYDQRGPLDRGHVRFFTKRSIERLFRTCGLRIVERAAVGTPFHTLEQQRERLADTATSVDETLMRVWPQLFTYQWLFRLETM